MLNTFFAGTSKPLRMAFAGVVIAATGAALGFALGDNVKPGNPLAYAAFAIVAIGVVIGFIAVAWGWYRFLRPDKRQH